jgi:hypothetical protein
MGAVHLRFACRGVWRGHCREAQGARAAPLSLLFIWLPFGLWFWGRLVLSDVPAAARTMLELAAGEVVNGE